MSRESSAPTPASDGIRDRIAGTCQEALTLDERLAAAVPFREETRGGSGEGGTGSGKIAHSPAPWNESAGICRMDLHALARKIEREWRAAAGATRLRRGGSDANTRAALLALPGLSHAAGVGEESVARSLRDLARWVRQARVILGDLERPRRLPAPPGEAEKECPWCHCRTLRMWPMRGIVCCVNPHCMIDGRRAVARLEYSAVAGMTLVWQDGSVL